MRFCLYNDKYSAWWYGTVGGTDGSLGSSASCGCLVVSWGNRNDWATCVSQLCSLTQTCPCGRGRSQRKNGNVCGLLRPGPGTDKASLLLHSGNTKARLKFSQDSLDGEIDSTTWWKEPQSPKEEWKIMATFAINHSALGQTGGICPYWAQHNTFLPPLSASFSWLRSGHPITTVLIRYPTRVFSLRGQRAQVSLCPLWEKYETRAVSHVFICPWNPLLN